MAGEKSLCSDFPQSTEKVKRCEPSEKQQVWCCSFLPTLGKLPPQKILLRWSWRCDGSGRSNTEFCRGCCSDHWGLACTLVTGLHTCTAFIAKASWIKAGVGVFPDTTTLPSHCSADRHTHTCAHTHAHMHAHIHRQSLESPTPAWSSPSLVQPVLFAFANSIAHTGRVSYPGCLLYPGWSYDAIVSYTIWSVLLKSTPILKIITELIQTRLPWTQLWVW